MPESQKIKNRPSDVVTETSEVFSSLQGEGPHLGKRQIFVRFGRCNMHCIYCDEVEKMQVGSYQDISLSALLRRVEELERLEPGHHSVSLTGGEPLFYPRFLKVFLPELKRRGFKTYLETNGTLPEVLVKVMGDIDIVAMDIKPPSSTQDKAYWDRHKVFLSLAEKKDVFVKIVVTSCTQAEEIERSIEIIHSIRSSIPLVFQPETELTGINLQALRKIKEEYVGMCHGKLTDVRIIPQMHRIWQIP